MLIALVAVVAAVALAVLGDGGALKEAVPDRLEDRLPPDRPLVRSDIDAVRLPVAVRGYRMLDVDEVLDRLGAELAERDARIAELETSLAGSRAGRGPGEYAEASAEHVRGQESAQAPGQEYGPEYAQDYRQDHGQDYGQDYGQPYGPRYTQGHTPDGGPGGQEPGAGDHGERGAPGGSGE